MAAKKLTNTTISTLGLPGGVMIAPGATVQVEDFEKMENHDVVKAWLESGALTEGAPRKAEKSPQEGDEGESSARPRDSAGTDNNRVTDERARSSQALNNGGEGAPIGTVTDDGKGDSTKAKGSKPWAAADEGASKAEAEAATQRAEANKSKK